MKVLILPGIGNSGPEHWQSHWEQSHGNYTRVNQLSWDNPSCLEWVASLEESVKTSGPNTILVAHSLACLLVAHWAVKTNLEIRAALLVAVPNPKSPIFPTEAVGFAPLPMHRLPFESIIVASTNDQYGGIEFSEKCASAWGSCLINIGEAEHINSSSGLGAWPEGHVFLQQLQSNQTA